MKFYIFLRYITSLIAGYCLLQLQGESKFLGILIIQIFIFLLFFTKRLENNNIVNHFDEKEGINLIAALYFIDAFILIGLSLYLLIITK